jgi:Zn-dependent M16 (insulinase) family peptidase
MSKFQIDQYYEKVWERDLVDLRSKAIMYIHKKTKAEVLVWENDDDNKAFGIGFTTLPEDSTGIAHIMEHSVLCNSRKYNVKSPFVELIKYSLNTYLNASTWPDKTVYPVSSQNEQDLHNLMDVYLDTAFFPKLEEKVLHQEGWHYEINDEGKLIYKGVVFNEMKASVSKALSVLEKNVGKRLLPGTLYCHNSGGDPQDIPNLNYENFLAFHKKYYHPSNAKIFFYGNGDQQRFFEHLEEYLSEFEYSPINASIDDAGKVEKGAVYEEKYGIGADESIEGKYYTTLNWMMPIENNTDRWGLNLLSYAFLASGASPFRKPILAAGLAEDFCGLAFDQEYKQPVFAIGFRGIQKENIEKVEDIIRDILNTLSKKIDKRLVISALNKFEFELREGDYGGSKGVEILRVLLSTWNYGGDPLLNIDFTEAFTEIRMKLENEELYFENLIKKYFIDNDHHVVVRLSPDPKLAGEIEMKEKEALAKIESKLTDEEKEGIKRYQEELHKWQTREDDPKEVAKLPKLKVSDLDKKPKEYPTTLSEVMGVEIIEHDLPTNGIVYLDVLLDVTKIPSKFLSYLDLYLDLTLKLDSKNYDSETLAMLIDSDLGDIDSGIYATKNIKTDEFIANIHYRSKFLVDKLDRFKELFIERIFNTHFDKKDHFLTILKEIRSGFEESFVGMPVRFAGIKARSAFSDVDAFNDKVSGLDYYFFIKEVIQNFDSNWDKVLGDIQELHKILLSKDLLKINITADQKDIDFVKENIKDFINRFETVIQLENEKLNFDNKSSVNTAYTIPSEVNFIAQAIDLKREGYKFDGAVLVLTNYLETDFYWERIRKVGGAYGGRGYYNNRTGVFTHFSWRDPNLTKSIDTFGSMPDFIEEMLNKKKDLSEFILGTIGEMDAYLTSEQKGWVGLDTYLAGVEYEDRIKRRDEVFAISEDKLREFAKYLRDSKKKSIAVFGNKSIIESSNGKGIKFEIINLL